jgi:hypothetical protein
VDRRGFLLGATALVLAGCARVQPDDGAQQTASPTPSGPIVGVDTTAVGTVIGALLTGSLNLAATTQPLGADWTTPLGKGAWSAAVVYSATPWSELSDSEDTPSEVLSELAGLVAPDISVLNPGVSDGALVWMVPTTAGVTSLDGLAAWSAGKVAVVPAFALERADGLPGLNAIYQTTFTSVTEDDPIARARAVASGQAAIGAFRRTEYFGDASLLELADPEKMSGPDVVTLLVNSTFANDHADLADQFMKVIQSLTTADLVALQKQVVAGSQLADVAHAWLVAEGVIS